MAWDAIRNILTYDAPFMNKLHSLETAKLKEKSHQPTSYIQMKCFQAILAAHSRVRFLISEVSSCVRSHLIQTKWLPSWSWNSTPSGNDGLALKLLVPSHAINVKTRQISFSNHCGLLGGRVLYVWLGGCCTRLRQRSLCGAIVPTCDLFNTKVDLFTLQPLCQSWSQIQDLFCATQANQWINKYCVQHYHTLLETENFFFFLIYKIKRLLPFVVLLIDKPRLLQQVLFHIGTGTEVMKISKTALT